MIWGIHGLVKLVVMKVHVLLQAARLYKLNAGLEEAPKSTQ